MRFNNLLGNFAGGLLSGSRVSFQHAPKFYGRVNLEPHNASNFHTQNGIFQTASAAVRDRHISQRCPSSAASINPDGNNDDTNSNSRTEPYSECEPRPSPLCWANPDATPPDIHTSHNTNGHTSSSSQTRTTSNPSTRVNKTYPPNTKTKNAPLRHPHAGASAAASPPPASPAPNIKTPSTPPPPSPSYASSSPFSTPAWDRPTPPPRPSPSSLPRPRPPPPASHPSHPNFTYGPRGLLYLSIPRFPPSVIKTLLSRPPAANTSADRCPWIAAQLALYGVACPADADAATQRRQLEKAVLAEELEVPEEVRAVEEAVGGLWEGKAAEELGEWKGRRFAMCRTMEEEVDMDVERFLRKYFPSGFGGGGTVRFPGAGAWAGEEAVVLRRVKEPKGLVEAVRGVEGLGCYVTEMKGVVGW